MKRYKYTVVATCGDGVKEVSVFIDTDTTEAAVIKAAMESLVESSMSDFGDGYGEIVTDTVKVVDDYGAIRIFRDFTVTGKQEVYTDYDGYTSYMDVPLTFDGASTDSAPADPTGTAPEKVLEKALEKAAHGSVCVYISEDGENVVSSDVVIRAVKMARIDELEDFLQSSEIPFEDGYIRVKEEGSYEHNN